jgi:hypothetical protein
MRRGGTESSQPGAAKPEQIGTVTFRNPPAAATAYLPAMDFTFGENL